MRLFTEKVMLAFRWQAEVSDGPNSRRQAGAWDQHIKRYKQRAARLLARRRSEELVELHQLPATLT